jgi:hypothetical protein
MHRGNLATINDHFISLQLYKIWALNVVLQGAACTTLHHSRSRVAIAAHVTEPHVITVCTPPFQSCFGSAFRRQPGCRFFRLVQLGQRQRNVIHSGVHATLLHQPLHNIQPVSLARILERIIRQHVNIKLRPQRHQPLGNLELALCACKPQVVVVLTCQFGSRLVPKCGR